MTVYFLLFVCLPCPCLPPLPGPPSTPEPPETEASVRLSPSLSVRAGQEEELGAGPKCAEDGVTLTSESGGGGNRVRPSPPA